MTVAYNSIGHVRPFGFARLLFRWRASIWQAIWKELCIWLCLFYLVSFFYRLSWVAEKDDAPRTKITFEHLVLDWNKANSGTIVTFVLGFYTSIMYTRFWSQFEQVPWIDPLCQALNVSLRQPKAGASQSPHPPAEELLLVKRQIARWVNLASALVYQDCSQKIKRTLPDLAALVRLGVCTPEERAEIRETPHDTHAFYLPYSWCHALLNQCQDRGMVRSDIHLRLLMDRLEAQRSGHGALLGYGWVAIPLVFTQVVTAAVYCHFAFALVGEQFLDPVMLYDGHTADWFIPFFSIMRIVTLVGWLKACELMKSPFGEDEDSFEIDWILRRNMDVGLDIVTREGARFPTLARDPHWERRTPGMDALRGKQARGRGGRASSYSGSTGRASDGMFPGPAGRAGGGGGKNDGDMPLL